MTDPLDPPEISSTYLLEVLDGRDEEHDPENAEAERRAAALVRTITQKTVNSRQKLIDLPIETLDELLHYRAASRWLLDDFFCHDLLERIPKMVTRTLELSSLTIRADALPKGSMHVFYEQSVRCYIFGLWQAASMLARGTVETALRERIGGQGRDRLSDLIDIAVKKRILVGPAIEAANFVKVVGDHAVHGEAMSEQKAKKLVICAREVLSTLFDGRIGIESRPS